MSRRISSVILFVAMSVAIATAQKPDEIATRRCASHPMIYLMSLPRDWSAEKSWPVVVAIEDANRDFARNMKLFHDARGTMPFILLVPEVVTNGGRRYREAPGYGYNSTDWTRISHDGEWKFDEDGIAAMVSDVHRLYNGDQKYFLTGWEAGMHTVFALAFNRPEDLRAVAAVCPNYQGRYVSFSTSPSRKDLRIEVFAGSDDPAWAPGQPLYVQTKEAEKEGKAHGFQLSYQTVKGKGHEPLPDAVLNWFMSLSRR